MLIPLFFVIFVAETRAAPSYPNSTIPTLASPTTPTPAGGSLISLLIHDIQNPFANYTCAWTTNANNQPEYNCTDENTDRPVCSRSFSSSLSTWASSIAGNPAPTAAPRGMELLHIRNRISQHVFTPTGLYSDVAPFTWTASEPCCGYCSIFGGTVQVYYVCRDDQLLSFGCDTYLLVSHTVLSRCQVFSSMTLENTLN